MKRPLWLTVALLLCATLLVAPVLAGSGGGSSKASTKPAPTPGLDLAQNISLVTGVAISPLLGVSAVGCWKRFHSEGVPPEKLPWFAQTWFWLPALILVGLTALKDSFGTVVPTALKKPLDVLEAFENKISALVAAGAFLPLVVSFTHAAQSAGAFTGTGIATLDLTPLYNIISVPVAIIIFGIVWIVSHAINMLILISPFSTVDAALKAFRTFILGSVVASSRFDPYVGAAWSVVLIIICYFLSGWAYRLMTFGSVFMWDLMTFGRMRFTPDPKANRMFLGRSISKVPIRTFGTLRKNDAGRLIFEYRPLLVFPQRTLELPPGRYVVGCGLFFSEVYLAEGEERTSTLLLAPRYRTHEQTLSDIYQFGPTEDAGIIKGIKSITKAIGELFGAGSTSPAR